MLSPGSISGAVKHRRRVHPHALTRMIQRGLHAGGVPTEVNISVRGVSYGDNINQRALRSRDDCTVANHHL